MPTDDPLTGMSMPPRRDPQPLDRQQITAVALRLLKDEGMKGISTRRLANALGIKSASLYHHFRDKQQLFDYITAAMIQPAWRRPRAGEAWQDWLIGIGHALRQEFHVYSDGALVAQGSTPPPEAYRDAVELLYEPLISAGWTREQTRNVILTVLRFVGGWTSDEQAARNRGAARPEDVAEASFAFAMRAIVSGCDLQLQAERRG